MLPVGWPEELERRLETSVAGVQTGLPASTVVSRLPFSWISLQTARVVGGRACGHFAVEGLMSGARPTTFGAARPASDWPRTMPMAVSMLRSSMKRKTRGSENSCISQLWKFTAADRGRSSNSSYNKSGRSGLAGRSIGAGMVATIAAWQTLPIGVAGYGCRGTLPTQSTQCSLGLRYVSVSEALILRTTLCEHGSRQQLTCVSI